jgi:hypothetical protein
MLEALELEPTSSAPVVYVAGVNEILNTDMLQIVSSCLTVLSTPSNTFEQKMIHTSILNDPNRASIN